MNRTVVNNALNKFLHNCNIDIKFKSQNELDLGQIKKILMIVLRSETNNLDGNYENYNSFIINVDKLKKQEDDITEYYDKLQNEDNNNINEYHNKYHNKVLKKSVKMYSLTIFLEDLDLDSCNAYLESRSWFINNLDLQEKTISVALDGNAESIDVRSGDYRDHIESLLE